MAQPIDNGETRVSKKTPVDDLKSPEALKLNDDVIKAQKEHSHSQSRIIAHLSSLKEETDTDESAKLGEAEQKAFAGLLTAIRAKRDYINRVYEKTQAIVNGTGGETSGRATVAGKTELSLVMAALNDIDSKLSELEGRRAKKSQVKRRTAIQKNKLEQEIAAVLEEANKTKSGNTEAGFGHGEQADKDNMSEQAVTNKIKQEADKVEENKKSTKAKTETVSGSERYRLKAIYKDTVVPAMVKQFNYKNINQVPKVDKIVLNMGLGDVKDDSKKFAVAVEELKTISGQKPMVSKAKKSVANFKVRQGMNIGAKVTLRGARMYEFLDKLISIALPRVRDFRGIGTKSFDGRGNFAMGIKEQLIFPEIKYDQVDKIRGFDVIVVTTANTDEEAKALLGYLGMPFKS